jgi:hypothetical protein
LTSLRQCGELHAIASKLRIQIWMADQALKNLDEPKKRQELP